MKLISVNIGEPRHIFWNKKSYYTSFFKQPVNEILEVSDEGLSGDMQANTKVHGGIDKAIYAYSVEHYSYWEKLLKRNDLTWGMFGENFTVSGDFNEEYIFIGDIFKVGSIEMMAAQPRQPCSKLNMRFEDLTMVKKFWESDKPGIYFRVLKEGEIQNGNTLEKIHESDYKISIAEIYRFLRKGTLDKLKLNKLLEYKYLPESLRKDIKKSIGFQA